MEFDHAWVQDAFDRLLPNAGYAVREEQLAMANYVQTALATNRHLLAEAGVGTGKTFAYLVPLIAHLKRAGGPVLVSTHTIALQEQLVRKDIPLIAGLLGVEVEALLAKGKEHFLCPARLEAYQAEHVAPDPAEERLYAWAERTRTGDRSELGEFPEEIWREVNWGERGPCAAQCRHADTCPSHAYRQRWQSTRGILVTNHHQFFADMALRAKGHHLFALPTAVVFDEAHALFETAREVLGHRTSTRAFLGAFETARSQLRRGDSSADPVVAAAGVFLDRLAEHVQWDPSEEADRLFVRTEPEISQGAMQLYEGGTWLIDRLSELKPTDSRRRAAERLEQAIAPLLGLVRPEARITWAEGRSREHRLTALASAPRDLSALLRERLFSRDMPVILTSATLSVLGSFDFFQREAGLENPLALSVGSPFDYAHHVRLYVPSDLPDPSHDADAFYAATLDRLKAVLTATRGRALVLYTSKTRAEEAVRKLKAWHRFPIYYEERPSAGLLRRFKRETESVLVGTAFWEGIDVPGESLSCVVMVKLPFQAQDPLVAAQEERARERGEDPFETVLLPEMLLKLRQGSGRLIRRESDRGVVVLLDPRALTRERYRDQVAESLPPCERVDEIEDLRTFLDQPTAKPPVFLRSEQARAESERS